MSHAHPPASRTPDTTIVLIAVVAVGMAQSLFQFRGGLTSNLTTELVFMWSVLLAVGGLISAVGIWYPERIAGIAIELIGRVILAMECYTYVLVAILFFEGNPLYLPIVLVAALALSSTWRVVQLIKYLRNTKHHLKRVLDLRSQE